MLANFAPEQGARAHSVAFALIYIFGIDYEKGKNSRKYKHFFDFVTAFMWKIRPKYLSSGTRKPIMKRVSAEAQKLWNNIFQPGMPNITLM